MRTRNPVRHACIIAFGALLALTIAPRAHAQTETPSIVIVGNSPRTEMVTIRPLDAARRHDPSEEITCVLPCTLPLPPGRYDVISLDADLHTQHHPVDLHSPNTRVRVDFRAHSDSMTFSTGVGVFSFGAILIGAGVIMGVGGLFAQNTADTGSASLMAQCTSRFTDPAAIAACCLNVSGNTNTGTTTGPGTATGTSSTRNQCVPQSFTADIASGVVAAGIGVVGIIVGSILMVRSAHVTPRDSQLAARRHSAVSLVVDSAVLPGGGAIGATLRF